MTRHLFQNHLGEGKIHFYLSRIMTFSVFCSYYVMLIYTSTLKVKYIPDSTDLTSLMFVHLFGGIRHVHGVRNMDYIYHFKPPSGSESMLL